VARHHRYRVTVEHLAPAKEGEALHAPLQFEAINHDEILAIADRLRTRLDYGDDETAQLAVGLKLFGEILLKHREDALFAPLRESFREFIGGLKKLPEREG
jgi:hypothetical protein